MSLLYGYEAVASFGPFLVAFGWVLWRRRRQGQHTTSATLWLIALFAAYMAAVYHVTGAGTLFEWLRFRGELRLTQVNLIPFSREIDPVAYALNGVLLLPLGALVPLIWWRMDRLWKVLLLGFAVSLLVEMSQLLNTRSPDIDDLILNTLGAVLGFGVFRLWERLTVTHFALGDGPLALLPVSILLPFMGRFLLFHEMGFAGRVFGF